jgi:cardiolipin synthase
MSAFRGRKWPWVVLIAAGIVVALLLLAQDQETLRIESPVAASSPDFPDYVASLVGAPVTRGDAYEVLENGDAIFPAMLAAVKGARSRISFESFIYSDGEVAREFTRAFADAARRGVTVRIVLDAFGASDLPADLVGALEEAGVHVRWFNPLHPWRLEESNYRTHRKVLVVDGGIGFTGGVGLADHWRGNARTRDEWRDTQFRVLGPAVRALEASFYENWLEAGGTSAPALDPEQPPKGTGAASITLWSSATGGSSNVKRLYLLSIAGARSTIDIQSPYFILDESTRWALDQARRRGVRVRLLTEGDVTDARAVKDASRSAYQGLLDGGYQLYEYEPTMMHVKALIVDRHWSVIGSANFDNRSFELNDEQTSAVHDPELAATLTASFERDLERATALSAQGWRERSIVRKAREWFWSAFGEVF